MLRFKNWKDQKLVICLPNLRSFGAKSNGFTVCRLSPALEINK